MVKLEKLIALCLKDQEIKKGLEEAFKDILDTGEQDRKLWMETLKRITDDKAIIEDADYIWCRAYAICDSMPEALRYRMANLEMKKYIRAYAKLKEKTFMLYNGGKELP